MKALKPILTIVGVAILPPGFWNQGKATPATRLRKALAWERAPALPECAARGHAAYKASGLIL